MLCDAIGALAEIAQDALGRLPMVRQAAGAHFAVIFLGVEQHFQQDIAHHVTVLMRQT